MPSVNWIEWIGYAASLVILVSFLTSSVLRLRLINLIGCGIFATYGFLIHSIPTGAVNLAIAVINVYYLIRMLRRKENFTIIASPRGDLYLPYFLKHYAEDIRKYYPNLKTESGESSVRLYVLRDMVTAGLFVGNRHDGDRFRIEADYSIPTYRDLKTGKHLYARLGSLPEFEGIRTLEVIPASKSGRKYFGAMGFRPCADGSGVYVREMPAN